MKNMMRDSDFVSPYADVISRGLVIGWNLLISHENSFPTPCGPILHSFELKYFQFLNFYGPYERREDF